MPNHSGFLTEYFGCPAHLDAFLVPGKSGGEHGYFRFGEDAICYGRLASGSLARFTFQASACTVENLPEGSEPLQLPFDPADVIDNLRRERYVAAKRRSPHLLDVLTHKTYYKLRPYLRPSLQRCIQRFRLRDWKRLRFPTWPVDLTVERIHQRLFAAALRSRGLRQAPFIWFWPDGAPGCAVVTHDVETSAGRDFCPRLMDLDDGFGIKSSFQVVPEERYSVPTGFLQDIRDRGCEVNVHDLNHDGNLFASHALFLNRAPRINHYAREYGAEGFRSGSLYRCADWYGAFEFSYDMSAPNVGHLDAQRGGCCTVMPYFVGRILELPVTLTQDYTLFHILRDYSIELWKRQIGLILAHNGLAQVIVHPDYLVSEKERTTYRRLLEHLTQLRTEKKTWLALPGEVNTWWRQRSQMTLIQEEGHWRIQGEGSDRARIAYATLTGEDSLTYTLPT